MYVIQYHYNYWCFIKIPGSTLLMPEFESAKVWERERNICIEKWGTWYTASTLTTYRSTPIFKQINSILIQINQIRNGCDLYKISIKCNWWGLCKLLGQFYWVSRKHCLGNELSISINVISKTGIVCSTRTNLFINNGCKPRPISPSA